VYGRHGASSVPASEAAILQMIKETDGANYEDLRSLNQDLTFTETGRFFKRKNIPFGHGQQKSLRLQTPDGIYTNLGLLLSEQSTHTIKLAVFEGYEKEVFRERREFSGSLLKQLNDAYHFLDMYNHTHAEIKGLYRVEHQDYPEDALREALLNALVHRDYGFSGSILISVFENRIEFVSIGGLPKGITLDDIQLGISVPRNENLANVFYRLQLVEAYGTGIPKIMRSYMDHQQQPSLQASSNAFKITLPNRNVNTVARKQPSYDFVRESTPAFGYYGEYDGPAALTESEEKALALFQKQPIVVRKDVEAALSVSQPMAVRVLRGLLDKGRIRSMGAGKNTRYTAR
jgi:ATP-dependent DNA helicase RecG